jgi:hypothetical protein
VIQYCSYMNEEKEGVLPSVLCLNVMLKTPQRIDHGPLRPLHHGKRRRSDHSPRGVLPSLLCLSVILKTP